MQINHWFPIPIVSVAVDSSLIDHTRALVDQYIDSEKLLELDPDETHTEILTTFYNNKDFLGKISDQSLLNFIDSKSREFLNLRGFDPTCHLEITSWLQVYPPGTHFDKHDHYGAILSGVVYLQTPQGCGNIRFYNPNTGRRATDVFFGRLKTRSNEYNHSDVEYTPIKGEMLMFESWLEHSVDVNTSSENRIAVSFNVRGDTPAQS
jgi:uncharacterized protein (TIGR02466 family)